MKTQLKKTGKSFLSTIEKFNSNLWHFHFIVQKKDAAVFVNGNDKRVLCTLNGTEVFQTALIAHGDGNYFINVNQMIRRRLKLQEGDEVHVKLEKDESEYGLPMPGEFKELLGQDDAGNEFFHQLTAGKQRTLLYIIGKPKGADLRIRNGIAVLEHLKRNEGKINYKQLNTDIKNTF